MNFGHSALSRRLKFRTIIVGLILLAPATGFAKSEPPSEWGIEQLMESLRQVKVASGHFIERRDLQMLTEPLTSSGTLQYTAPDKLQKVTLEPNQEQMVVDGDVLTIEQGPNHEKRTFELHAYPEIWAFVESIRGTLAGNLETLQRFYTLKLIGGMPDWQLQLEPKEAKMRDIIEWIRIVGSQTSIRNVETLERGGDFFRMTVTEDPQ